jgi:hypothetical protein
MTAGCHHDHCTGPRETKLVEITDEEYALFQKLASVWYHSEAEITGAFFICGRAGEEDEMGLPDAILVCPQMGSNITAIYEKKTVGRSGQ